MHGIKLDGLVECGELFLDGQAPSWRARSRLRPFRKQRLRLAAALFNLCEPLGVRRSLSQRMRARRAWAAPAIPAAPEQTLQHSHSFFGTAVVDKNAGLEKLCFGSDMPAAEDRFNRLQDCLAVGFAYCSRAWDRIFFV